MKYHPIDRDLFVKNRAKFTAQMKPNSVAVFNSNDIYPVSADSTLPFAQHRDIFYLSGVDQEETILERQHKELTKGPREPSPQLEARLFRKIELERKRISIYEKNTFRKRY